MKKFITKKLHLVNHTINIEMFNDDTCPIKGEKLHGLFSSYHNKLLLHSDRTLQTIKETFLHELIHACDNNVGIKSLTESQIEMLLINLLYFMQNNTKIVDFLKLKQEEPKAL